jgi:hypothetical protein
MFWELGKLLVILWTPGSGGTDVFGDWGREWGGRGGAGYVTGV